MLFAEGCYQRITAQANWNDSGLIRMFRNGGPWLQQHRVTAGEMSSHTDGLASRESLV